MRSVTRVIPEGARPDDPHFITIDPLLSPDECREWIDFAERLGFYDAPINMGGGREAHRPDIRNNRRTLVDDPERASALWERTRPQLPAPVLRSGRAELPGLPQRGLRRRRDGARQPRRVRPYLHEGREVLRGVKYVLRTDVMYRFERG